MTTVVYVILLYVMVSVDGTSGQISTPTLYATGCRNHDLELHCNVPDHVIHVIGVYLGEGPGGGSGCDLEEEDCFIHHEDFNKDVMEACHHQHECSGVTVPNVRDYCDNDPSRHRFDYGVVEYRCVHYSTANASGVYATACRDEVLELHCHIPDEVISIVDVLLGERPDNFGCTVLEGDCFGYDEDFYRTVHGGCDGQPACSGIPVPKIGGECDEGDRYKNPFDYGLVVYKCLFNSDMPNTSGIFFSGCTNTTIDFELCSMPYQSISDIHVGLSAEQHNEHAVCAPEEQSCFSGVFDKNSIGYTGLIFEKCSGKRACTNLVIQSETMDCGGDVTQSEMTHVLYRCTNDTSLLEASQHFNDTFSDVTCGPDATIQVINGFYGDTGSEGLGSNGDISIFDCRVNVDADYMETITDSCDGQRSCGDLRAQRSSGTYCNPDGWPNEYSEYVTLVYICIVIPDPSTGPGSPTTQTDRLYTADPPTQSPPNTSPNTGLVVGVVVGVALVIAAVIIVVVFMLRKKRTRKAPSPQPTTAAYPNAIYEESPDNTSPVTSCGPGNGAALGPQAASTEPPEYSLATAVDEYSVPDKTKKRPKAGHKFKDGPRDKSEPREAYAVPDKNIHGYIQGQDPQTERTKNSTPSDEENVDYVNYKQTGGRGASSERSSQVELDIVDLVLIDNANYGTGPLKHNTQGTPAGGYSTADSRGTRRPDGHDTELVLVDNANYGSSLWAKSDDAYSGVNEGGQTHGGTADSRGTGRSDGDDTDLVIVDNASYGSILRGDSSDVYSAVHEGDQARNHRTGPALGDTEFEIMDNPNYA